MVNRRISSTSSRRVIRSSSLRRTWASSVVPIAVNRDESCLVEAVRHRRTASVQLHSRRDLRQRENQMEKTPRILRHRVERKTIQPGYYRVQPGRHGVIKGLSLLLTRVTSYGLPLTLSRQRPLIHEANKLGKFLEQRCVQW